MNAINWFKNKVSTKQQDLKMFIKSHLSMIINHILTHFPIRSYYCRSKLLVNIIIFGLNFSCITTIRSKIIPTRKNLSFLHVDGYLYTKCNGSLTSQAYWLGRLLWWMWCQSYNQARGPLHDCLSGSRTFVQRCL